MFRFLTFRGLLSTAVLWLVILSTAGCAALTSGPTPTGVTEYQIEPVSPVADNPALVPMGRDLTAEGANNSNQLNPVPTLLPTAEPQGLSLPTPATSTSEGLIPWPRSVPLDADPDSYFISGFACTGSMRPALDCGDEAIFLKPPFERPLAVGDVVSFSVDVSCRYYKTQSISKAHRIISIRYENDTPFFTTQGDSSFNPDPCEISMEQIDGLLAEVRKGARPQDVIDSSEYDQAKLAVAKLKEEYSRQLDEYNLEKAAYEALVAEYDNLAQHYQKGDVSFPVVSAFYEGLEERRQLLNNRRDGLNNLSDDINLAIDEVDRLYQQLFIS